jgi:heme/copper-type cytochrome/quinol oxidase subunit 4
MKETHGLNQSCIQQIRRYAIGYTILIGMYLIFILLYIYPHWPKDVIGWLILIFAGIPVAVGFDLIVEIISNKEKGWQVSKKTFSLKRILVGIIFCLTMITISIFIFLAFSTYIGHHFR